MPEDTAKYFKLVPSIKDFSLEDLNFSFDKDTDTITVAKKGRHYWMTLHPKDIPTVIGVLTEYQKFLAERER